MLRPAALGYISIYHCLKMLGAANSRQAIEQDNQKFHALKQHNC